MFVWLRMPWEFVRLMTRKSWAAQRNYTNRLTVSHSRLLETQLNQERDRITMRRLTAGLVIFALVFLQIWWYRYCGIVVQSPSDTRVLAQANSEAMYTANTPCSVTRRL